MCAQDAWTSAALEQTLLHACIAAVLAVCLHSSRSASQEHCCTQAWLIHQSSAEPMLIGEICIYNSLDPLRAPRHCVASACRPVCELYGVDLGYGSDLGAVTQRDRALVMMSCSTELEGFSEGCLDVASPKHPTSALLLGEVDEIAESMLSSLK